MTTKVFQKRLSIKTNPFFLNLGFVEENARRLIYEDDKVYDKVMYFARVDFKCYYVISMRFSRKFKIIDGIWEDLWQKTYLHKPPISSISIDQLTTKEKDAMKLIIDGQNKTNEEIIHLASLKLIDIYRKIILPKFEKCSNLFFLDKYYNQPFDKESGGIIWIHKLIIAKLSNNINYKKIYDYTMTTFQGHILTTKEEKEVKKLKLYIEALEEVYNRLQSISSPTNPYLGSSTLRDKVLGELFDDSDISVMLR